MKFTEYVGKSSVRTVNLEKKLLQFQRYGIFPRGYFLARPVNIFDVTQSSILKLFHTTFLPETGYPCAILVFTGAHNLRSF